MKTLWLLRHGDNVLGDAAELGTFQFDSPLSKEGREGIDCVREAHLVGQNFKIKLHSPLRRARETAYLAVQDDNWSVLPNMGPRLLEIWDTLLAPWKGVLPPNLLEVIDERWPGFLEMELQWAMRGLEVVLETLKDGEQALLVGHQPMLGLVRATLDRRHSFLDQSLPKGGIYRCTFHNSTTKAQVESLLPPPA